MRVAIVNDAAIAVEMLQRVLAGAPDCEVAWVARDGVEAVRLCERDLPDVVLMDLVMPVMNGVAATREIMRKTPCPILIVTAAAGGDEALVFESMGNGALDAFGMPTMADDGSIRGGERLLAKLATIAKLIQKPKNGKQDAPAAQRHPGAGRVPPLVVIGSSTGGPKALGEVLSAMPRDFKAAVAIVQHVDPQFAPGLAEWLDNQTQLTVRLGRAGDTPEPGLVLMAHADKHMLMNRDLTIGYSDSPRDYAFRPSVDVFFESVAERWPRKSVGVLMTGMGKDGARGLGALKRAGWHTIAQDEMSCVVFGMPKAAIEQGAASEILPLDRIASAISARV